jgi:hypothetical protein
MATLSLKNFKTILIWQFDAKKESHFHQILTEPKLLSR